VQVSDDSIIPSAGRGALPERDARIERAVEIAAFIACIAALAWSFAAGERVPLLAGADLGFHELGHLLAAFLPPIAQAVAGSLLQVGVPLGIGAYFRFVRGETGAAALMLAWAGTAMRDVSVYVADAPYEALPLIGGRHDWAFVFGPAALNDLAASAVVSRAVWVLGLLTVVAGIALCVDVWVRDRIRLVHVRRERDRLARLPRRERPRPVRATAEVDAGPDASGADAADDHAAAPSARPRPSAPR